MEVRSKEVIQLIEQAAAKSKLSTDHSSLGKLSECINEANQGDIQMNQSYLYKIYKKAIRLAKKEETMMGVNIAYLHVIASFLGFTDFWNFKHEQNLTASFIPTAEYIQLKSCLGNWYSYVRENSGLDYILQAPVRIFEEQHEVMMELRGRHRFFMGKPVIRGGCLNVFLDSEYDKQLFIIFRIGSAQYPQVLQGIFAAMSASGDPIGGREVFIKEEVLTYEEMHPQRLFIPDMQISDSFLHQTLASYFSEYEGNNLKITQLSTFTLDDLR